MTEAPAIPLRGRKPTTVLMGRAKNEVLHLLEWISYHKVIGFDDIVIFSNPGEDGTEAVLAKLAAAGIIHHQDCRLAAHETPDREMNTRLIAYTQALPYEWGALFDIDEFLLLKRHDSVGDLLAEFGHADAVALNWRNFGSSGLQEREEGLTIERFTRCAVPDSPMNRWVKSFGRLDQMTGGGPHYFHLRRGNARYFHVSGAKFMGYANQEAVNHDVASLNHYAVRSRKEFTLKRLRGDAMQAVEKQAEINRYNHHYFRSRDLNDCADDAIARHAAATRRLMREYAERAQISGLLLEAERAQAEIMRGIPAVQP